ncbi:YihY/virulence factor BrkB family protein [Aurantiacibacter gangjinensis]|uniref:Uncharacterized protein n=1 Tax=Aurantiacibacter gangjinensis TaxID=502682 RepID=A0A0G9MLP8_9SPHN|nr:YihY/virulence factor BrkB family protein [Aurantiacibacter gangjinensis]APE27532.1 Ribonuclease BN [Aurantiacibacter gangjinensis]KLE31584.1 hypothetical protein AAW01_08485 [Aurantiacibacter gangjinensis]
MALISDTKAAWAKATDNDLSVLAAGVAYFAFLSFVPLLAASVLSYGLVADPQTVANHIGAMAQNLPDSAATLIGDQLEAVVETSSGTKGLALLLALALALISARSSATALVRAIAIAFGDEGRRGFVRANLFAVTIVIGVIVGAGLLVAGMGFVTAFAERIGLGALSRVATLLMLVAIFTAGIAALIRRAPPSIAPSWRAAMQGAFVAAAGIVAFTAAFGFYVANFGSYNATYGSLGAVIVLLTWLYLSAYVLLLGAQFTAVRRCA